MRPYGKNIEKTLGLGEVFAIIDEHEDLKATERTSRAIQQILDI